MKHLFSLLFSPQDQWQLNIYSIGNTVAGVVMPNISVRSVLKIYRVPIEPHKNPGIQSYVSFVNPGIQSYVYVCLCV